MVRFRRGNCFAKVRWSAIFARVGCSLLIAVGVASVPILISVSCVVPVLHGVANIPTILIDIGRTLSKQRGAKE